jgi:peptidoglycan/xylan/chitin deacetylase (PgdA/CDA1 family)
MSAERDAMSGGRFPWPGGATAAVVLTFDVDAESGVLWEFPDTARRLGIMSHQAYGPRAGLPRLLGILARHGARATFFVPGFTADVHPSAVRSIVDAGHEVAHHGYVHEIVTELSPEDEVAVLERGSEVLERVTGVRPRGWRAPMWELNYRTPALLAAHGFFYDSSLMDADVPYRLATGPESGAATLVEIPPHWSLDDGEQYAWLPGIWDTAVIEGPDKLLRMWEMDFEATLAEGGCLVLTMHPFLSGRPARAAAFERLLERIAGTPGVWVATATEVADHVDALAPKPVFHEPPPIAASDLARRISPASPTDVPKEDA